MAEAITTGARAIAAEGARIGIVTCTLCVVTGETPGGITRVTGRTNPLRASLTSMASVVTKPPISSSRDGLPTTVSVDGSTVMLLSQ